MPVAIRPKGYVSDTRSTNRRASLVCTTISGIAGNRALKEIARDPKRLKRGNIAVVRFKLLNQRPALPQKLFDPFWLHVMNDRSQIDKYAAQPGDICLQADQTIVVFHGNFPSLSVSNHQA